MNDDNEPHVCRCSAMQWAQAIAIIIGALGTAGAACIGAYFSVANHTIAEAVATKQDQQVESAKGRDDKLTKIEETAVKTAKVVEDATATNLAASWVYLKGRADDEPTPENLARAKEAKRIYDEYLSRKKP